MKLGILGGTFDPIHLGHLRVAEEIAEDLGLKKVYIIPSAVPPHKTGRLVTPFKHRLAMAHLATKDVPMLEVMDLESKRQGASYSIETLKELHTIVQPDPDLFFIIGIDAFLEIETWKEYRDLFNYTKFVVIERPGYGHIKLGQFIKTLGLKLGKIDTSDDFIAHGTKNILIQKTTHLDISSTDIRKRVAKGKSIRFLTPSRVYKYIFQKGLYKINAST